MRECTPALFNQVVDSEQTARVCAEIEDALEQVRRGEMSREDFEAYKAEQKKRLAIFTPHATFPKGRRVNEDAVPSGLSMYDVDHIGSLTPDPSPKGEGSDYSCGQKSLYERLVEHTLAKRAITDEGMKDELRRLGVCLVHVTPSTEGFRLFFVVPEGMSLAEAQRWMSEQLGDDHYDGCVKDLARCSFAVPREYILYLDEEGLFKERKSHTPGSLSPSPSPKGRVALEGSDYSQGDGVQAAGHSTPLPHREGQGGGSAALASLVGFGSIILGVILALMPTTFITGLQYVMAAMLVLGAVNQFVNLAQASRWCHVGWFYWLLPVVVLLVALFMIWRPIETAAAPLFIIGWCMLLYGMAELLGGLMVWKADRIVRRMEREAEQARQEQIAQQAETTEYIEVKE